MPEPECYLPGWVMASRDDDLGPMVDTLRELMLGGSITGYPMILSPVAAASVFTDRAHWYQGEGRPPRGGDRAHLLGARLRALDDALRDPRRRGDRRP